MQYIVVVSIKKKGSFRFIVNYKNNIPYIMYRLDFKDFMVNRKDCPFVENLISYMKITPDNVCCILKNVLNMRFLNISTKYKDELYNQIVSFLYLPKSTNITFDKLFESYNTNKSVISNSKYEYFISIKKFDYFEDSFF